jgi:hypothetical protein
MTFVMPESRGISLPQWPLYLLYFPVQAVCEAHRLLIPGGRLCLVSLTHGTSWLSRLVIGVWARVHRLAPTLVGGCRPLELRALLPAHPFQLEYVKKVTAFGIPSEIIVAKREAEAREAEGMGNQRSSWASV